MMTRFFPAVGLVLMVFAFGSRAQAGVANERSNQIPLRGAENMFAPERAFPSAVESFQAGTAWWRNAMVFTSSTGHNLTVVESASALETGYVGTLANPYSSDIAVSTSPFYRTFSGAAFVPLAPNAVIEWANTFITFGSSGSWIGGTGAGESTAGVCTRLLL